MDVIGINPALAAAANAAGSVSTPAGAAPCGMLIECDVVALLPSRSGSILE
jgi:hypothetical protein